MLATNKVKKIQMFRSEKLNQIEVKFKWHIEDFRQRTKFFVHNGANAICCPGKLSVPVFNTLTKDYADLTLNIGLNTYLKPNGNMRPSIVLSNEQNECLLLKCDVLVQDNAGREICHLNNCERRLESDSQVCFEMFTNTHAAFRIYEADSLVIQLDITFFSCKWKNRRVFIEKPWFIQSQLLTFFQEKQFSDIQIECGGKVFPCHKLILAASSDVFQSMFAHENMSECQNRLLSIGDMQPETVGQMLEFIYTGKTAGVQENTLNLFAAADKYNLQSLKMECEEALSLQIKEQNAAETFVAAYLHESFVLKKSACEYIRSNISQVCDTPGWQNLVVNYPALLTDIFKCDKESESKVDGK